MKPIFKNVVIALLGMMLLNACNSIRNFQENRKVVIKPAPQVVDNSTIALVWKNNTAGSALNAQDFEPTIVGNEVYLAARNGRIEGYSLDSGNQVFNYDLDQRQVSGVGANVTHIYAVSRSGEVIAIDRNSGSEKWRYAAKRSISARPIANDQMLIVRTIDGHVIGLNAITGEFIWGLERPVSSLSVGLDAPSLMAGEGVVTGFSSGRILANNVFNGNAFWEKRAFLPQGRNDIERLIDIDAQPILVGQAVIAGAIRGGVAAFSLRDGNELWRNQAVDTGQTIHFAGQSLAVTTTESDVVMLDASTGKTVWRQNTLSGQGLSAPVIHNDRIVVGSNSGTLYFLELSTGNVLSKFDLTSAPISAIRMVDQGVLVYSASSGAIFLLR